MSTAEVRAAAKSVRAKSGAFDATTMRELWVLATAYLTEHRDDDDEGLDSDNWISRVTTPCEDHGLLLGKIHELSVEIEASPDGFKLWLCPPDRGPVPVRWLTTRGDVRRVCRSLGLKLIGD